MPDILWLQRAYINVGSEVLKTVVMKGSIFWDITPCRIWGSQNGRYEEFYLLGYNAVKVELLLKVNGEIFGNKISDEIVIERLII
jgi:hypothetical protein